MDALTLTVLAVHEPGTILQWRLGGSAEFFAHVACAAANAHHDQWYELAAPIEMKECFYCMGVIDGRTNPDRDRRA